MKTDKKRPYGTGTIFQSSTDNRWVAKISLGSDNEGKRKVRVLYGATEKEVAKKLKEYQKNPINQTAEQNKSIRFSQYLEMWLKTYKQGTLKPSSYDRLESIIKHHINPNIGMVGLGALTSDDIQTLLNQMKKDGLSHSSIKKVYDTCNACLTHAAKTDAIIKNPCLVVNAPSIKQFEIKKIRALTKQEEVAMLNELDILTKATQKPKYKYRAAYILLLNTGIRIGELVALDWFDINLEKKNMHVSKNAILVKDRDEEGNYLDTYSQIIQPSTKTDKERDVPLNKKALSALEELKKQAGKAPYVLTTINGTRTNYNTVERQFGNVLRACDIQDAGIHTLRHTFATRLFEKGAEVKTVSILLGHSTTSITYNTYINVIKEKQEEVVSLLDN